MNKKLLRHIFIFAEFVFILSNTDKKVDFVKKYIFLQRVDFSSTVDAERFTADGYPQRRAVFV